MKEDEEDEGDDGKTFGDAEEEGCTLTVAIQHEKDGHCLEEGHQLGAYTLQLKENKGSVSCSKTNNHHTHTHIIIFTHIESCFGHDNRICSCLLLFFLGGGGGGEGGGGGDLFVGCLTPQQHASVSQGWICSDNFTVLHATLR